MAHMMHWVSPITLENMDDMNCIDCDLFEHKLRDGRNFRVSSQKKNVCAVFH